MELSPKKNFSKVTNMSDMDFTRYRRFTAREDTSCNEENCFASTNSFEDNRNSFGFQDVEDQNPVTDVEEVEEYDEEDEFVFKMLTKLFEYGDKNPRIAKAFKRFPNEKLKILGISRDELNLSPNNKTGREESKEKITPNREGVPKYNPPHKKGTNLIFNNHNNPLFEQGDRERWSRNNSSNERGDPQRQPNNGRNYHRRHQNDGNHYNDTQNYQRANHQNTQGQNRNYHNAGQRMRAPMVIERYRQLDFDGIRGYPNPISNDLRIAIPKFSGNGVESAKQHVINLKNTIEELEQNHEDTFMKFFVQSLTEDAAEWYRSLPDRSITGWCNFVD